MPRNIAERTDAEIMEKIFGKRVKKELDKLVTQPESVTNKGALNHLK